ncbi:MAG: carboxypeptidase-like regulatory domain-containing protein [Myxococcota bacterium]
MRLANPAPTRLFTWAFLLLALTRCSDCETENIQENPGILQGTVCHQVNGRPSIGAKITVTDESGATVLEGLSDNLGQYEIGNIPPGTANVTMNGEGVNNVKFAVPIKSDQTVVRKDPACIDPTTQVGKGCVAGQVCNKHTGNFVGQAQVAVILSNVNYSGETELEATTDDNGVFQICDVPEGSHVVQVRANGFQKAYPANVTQGQTTEVVSAPQCQAYDPTTHCRVTGRICSASTPPEWLADARVTALKLNADGTVTNPVIYGEEEEFTDADGNYEMFLQPAGKWRIQVVKGNFISRTDIDCLANETTAIPEGTQCVSASECRFLVAQGIFDRVEQVLGRVGVDAEDVELINGNPANFNEDWAFNAFGDYNRFAGVCGVFFNCGINESAFFGPGKNPVVIQNLQRFVQEGGTLYASDQSYDVVEALFPEKVDWFRNDDIASDAEYGLCGIKQANVVDPSLSAYLAQENPGQNTVEINFAYQSWSVVQALDADVQVFLRASIDACSDGDACSSSVTLNDTPLTIRFPVGTQGGQVIFTSFHVEAGGDEETCSGSPVSTEDTDRVMRFLMTL